MTWGEAVRLTTELAADTSSRVGARLAGLRFPASWEYIALQRMNANEVARRTEKRPRLLLLPDPFEPAPIKFGTPMSKEALRAVIDAHRALPAIEQEGRVIEGG